MDGAAKKSFLPHCIDPDRCYCPTQLMLLCHSTVENTVSGAGDCTVQISPQSNTVESTSSIHASSLPVN
jgi:hypothetical protein